RARISSTRCSADLRLSVPDSAWLTSSSVDRRRASRPCPAAVATVCVFKRAIPVISFTTLHCCTNRLSVKHFCHNPSPGLLERHGGGAAKIVHFCCNEFGHLLSC